jgi:transcriptional regulator with XRE-family HTH domain
MEKVSPAKVGERIRAIRGNRTQTEFAKELGVRKQNYISRYERGRIPSPNLLAKIAEMGRVSVDWLLVGKKGRGGAVEVRESRSAYGKSPASAEIEGILSKLKPRDKTLFLKMVRKFAKDKRVARPRR